jgi:hypothetical protein
MEDRIGRKKCAGDKLLEAESGCQGLQPRRGLCHFHVASSADGPSCQGSSIRVRGTLCQLWPNGNLAHERSAYGES